ncbi:MAG: DUF1565 domain-containing protein [Chitinispirillaceae bacterium]|nr:DUF1565 domain-containing protein [Chitinispirillaceae bacterium]
MKTVYILLLIIAVIMSCTESPVTSSGDEVVTGSSSIFGTLLTDGKPSDEEATVSLYLENSGSRLSRLHANTGDSLIATIETSDAAYSFDELSAGTYRIEVSREGIVIGEETNIALDENEDRKIDITIVIIINQTFNISTTEQNITINNFFIENGKVTASDSGYTLIFADTDTITFEIVLDNGGTTETIPVTVVDKGDGNFTIEVPDSTDAITITTTETTIPPDSVQTINNALLNAATNCPIAFDNSAITYSISGALSITSACEVVFGPDILVEVKYPITIEDGGSLRILEGTTMRFANSAYISVGGSGTGTLTAIGTENDSVFFERLTSTGNWGSAGGSTSRYFSGIRFFGGATEACSLSYCSIESAYRGILVSGAKITVSHTTISDNRESGCLFEEEGTPVDSANFTHNSIHHNGGYGISIAADFVGAISSSCMISDNTGGGILIAADKVEHDAIWNRYTDPYVVNSTIEFASDEGVTVIITAGTTFLMGNSARLTVGASLQPGTFIANGTESDSITFTSLTNTSYWGPGTTGANQIGMVFTEDASPSCSLTYCVLNRATNAVAINNTRITIANSRISNCERTGIAFNENASPVDSNAFTDNIITENGHYGVEMYANFIGMLDGTGTFAGNATGGILILGDKVEEDAVWKKHDVPYVVSGKISIGSVEGATLTIQEGTSFLMQDNATLDVGSNGSAGTLVADGTADDHIIFASFGSDHWGTASSGPVSGAIYIRNTADENTSLTYCDIISATTGIHIFDIEPTVMNCTISNCQYYGITLEGSTGTTVSDNTFTNNTLEDIHMQ